MSEVNSLKAKIQIPNDNPKKFIFQKQFTYKDLCDWIKEQNLEEALTEGLIKLAGTYPAQALPSFKKNFSLMVNRVRSRL